MKRFRVEKKWLLDKFKDTIQEKQINDVKSDFVYICFADEEQARSLQQNATVHALIGELYKSGLTSFNNYNECRDYFKEQAGLISREQEKVHPAVKNIQRKVYSMLTNKDLKDMYAKSILEGQKTVRSVSDASKEELTVMIKSVIDYCYQVDLNTSKFNEIMKGLGDVS